MVTEVPVYLFTGFLESGKTTFMQETLEEEEFNIDEKTLLLICEEGEVEYDPARFYNSEDVFFEYVDSEDDITPEKLESLRAKHNATRAVIEWNGMWDLKNLYEKMPAGWMIYQQTMFADAGTFLMYNENIRQRTFDQLAGAELIVFNRCVKDEKFREWQLQVHKICRVASRSSQIVYEFSSDDVLLDDIQDPLPYDMDKKLLVIEDQFFAEWYRDINENQDDYHGKEIIIKGRAAVGEGLAADEFIFGRHVMTCCEADITFAGLLCKGSEKKVSKLSNGQWVEIRANIRNEFTGMYGEVGPVLYCSQITKVEPCKPEVATF
ncbi:MAG: GTP-binding protein [Bacillota bacterium]|nr:GTP-binding protein [Bacillota bacterium]